jgi:hypothetical protein
MTNSFENKKELRFVIALGQGGFGHLVAETTCRFAGES